MFGIQKQQLGRATAGLMLAVTILMAPGAHALAAEPTASADPAFRGVAASPSPTIEVTYLRKVAIQYPVHRTSYRFTAKNTGNVKFKSVDTLGYCHYQRADGSIYWFKVGETTPDGMSMLEPNKSFEFVFYCDNVHNGDKLHHGRGMAWAYFYDASGNYVHVDDEAESS